MKPLCWAILNFVSDLAIFPELSCHCALYKLYLLYLLKSKSNSHICFGKYVKCEIGKYLQTHEIFQIAFLFETSCDLHFLTWNISNSSMSLSNGNHKYYWSLWKPKTFFRLPLSIQKVLYILIFYCFVWLIRVTTNWKSFPCEPGPG